MANVVRQADGTESSLTLGAAHLPLRDAVADSLREQIVSGRYRPGERLGEEAVATDLGVSRNPIREAFQSLAAEGFVELEPRRGARVAKIEAATATEIFEVREALEGLVAELAALHHDDDQVAELERIVGAGKVASESGELAALPALNTEFHQHLAAMAANAVLARMLGQLAAIIRWIYAERIAERVEASWHEHEQLAAAVIAGEAKQANELAAAHVRSARAAFLD